MSRRASARHAGSTSGTWFARGHNARLGRSAERTDALGTSGPNT